MLADVVVDGRHRLDGARGRTGEGELAIDDFALVHCERAVAEHDEATVGEGAAFIFVEIKDDFLIAERVFGDFHRILSDIGFRSREREDSRDTVSDAQ